MRDLFKTLLLHIWPYLYRNISFLKKYQVLNKRICMARLMRDDPVQWRVERARENGVIVGKDCRFFSLNIFSEPYLIEIGDNVIISGEVIFVTHDGAIYLFKDEDPHLFGHFGRIIIGNNCFIGMGAIILPNVEIGDNCIVGAGAVVMESIPHNSVVAGNPAKVIFKTDLYRRMKLGSKYTLRDQKYAFPRQNEMSFNERKDKITREIKSLPTRRPRKRSK